MLNEIRLHEDIWRSGGTDLSIVNLVSIGRSVVSFTPRPPYSDEKGSQYPVFRSEKFLAKYHIEPQFDSRPACRQVTIPTALPYSSELHSQVKCIFRISQQMAETTMLVVLSSVSVNRSDGMTRNAKLWPWECNTRHERPTCVS